MYYKYLVKWKTFYGKLDNESVLVFDHKPEVLFRDDIVFMNGQAEVVKSEFLSKLKEIQPHAYEIVMIRDLN